MTDEPPRLAGQPRRDKAARSSADRRHDAAAALTLTCSGEVAPAITEATPGWAASQATASSSTVWPRSSAKAVSASTRSKFSSVRTEEKYDCDDRRAPAGYSAPRRYFPVSNPDASGK